MSNPDLSWMNTIESNGRTWRENNTPDLSWMNVPGPDGRTWLQNRLATPDTGTKEQKDAYSQVVDWCKSYGLEKLSDRVWAYMVENGTTDKIGLRLWMYEQPEFKERFPALETLSKAGHAITTDEYKALETQYKQIMSDSGMLSSFFDKPDDFTALISNQVSPAEFQSRIKDGYSAVVNADPTVREAFRNYFGINGDDALAAFFIDPKRSTPKLIEAAKTAEIGAAAKQMNANIGLDYASKLMTMGVTYDQALAGFNKMASNKELFSAGVNETEITSNKISSDAIFDGTGNVIKAMDASNTNNENQLGVDYVFGTNMEVKKDLERRLNQRKAQASGETQQVVTNRLGRTSFGSAN